MAAKLDADTADVDSLEELWAPAVYEPTVRRRWVGPTLVLLIAGTTLLAGRWLLAGEPRAALADPLDTPAEAPDR